MTPPPCWQFQGDKHGETDRLQEGLAIRRRRARGIAKLFSMKAYFHISPMFGRLLLVGLRASFIAKLRL